MARVGPYASPRLLRSRSSSFHELLTLVTIPRPQFFLVADVSPHDDENTMPRSLQPGLAVHAVDLEIHVPFA